MKLKLPKTQKTSSLKSAEVKRQWHLVDAQGQVLGRLATEVAGLLIGKHKPNYTPHIDGGDYVVVINAKSVKVTGRKETDKLYRRHSGYLGGLKTQTLAEMRELYPERIIERAVYNMLPKNKLRGKRMNRLKVYASKEHKHESQLKGA